MIVSILCGATIAGLIVALQVNNKKLKKLQHIQANVLLGEKLPLMAWYDANKVPVPDQIVGPTLVWDGKDWSILSVYSTPTYSKRGRRNYYTTEIKAWGYLPSEGFFNER